jgi:hypothetical protein
MIGFYEQYKQDADQEVGIGTLISLQLPFSILYLILFTALLVSGSPWMASRSRGRPSYPHAVISPVVRKQREGQPSLCFFGAPGMVVVFGENVLSGEGKKRKQDRTARFFPSRMKNSFLKDSGPEKKLGVHFSPCFSLCFFPYKTGRTWGRKKRYCGEQSFSRSGVKQK